MFEKKNKEEKKVKNKVKKEIQTFQIEMINGDEVLVVRDSKGKVVEKKAV